MRKSFKRTAAFVLALSIAAGYTPTNMYSRRFFGGMEIVASATDTATIVNNYEELQAALNNTEITTIQIAANINVPCETVGTAQEDTSSCQLIINRSLTIESVHGQKFMIKRTQASGATNGSLKSLFGIRGNGTGEGFNNVTTNTIEVSFRNLTIDGGANWGESGLSATSCTNTDLSGRSIIDVYQGATLNLEDGLVIRNGHITKPNNTFNLKNGDTIDASGNYGGGIRVEFRPEHGGGTVNVKAGAEIYNCRAGGYGGALGAYNFAHLNVYGGTIHNCIATRGGAIGCTYRGSYSAETASTAGTITMYGGLIYDCCTVKADGENPRGGALELEGNTQDYILGGTIRNCSSTDGGAIGTDYGTVTIYVPNKTTNLLNISNCSGSSTNNEAGYDSIFLCNQSKLEVPQILTITFDARRNENDTYAELTVQKDISSDQASLGEAFPGAPVRPGYTFVGWYDNPEFVGEPKNKDTVFNVNTTLYAKWTANTYTLSYNANGGKLSGDTSKTVTYDQAYGELPTPTAPSGYTFAGWYTDETGGTEVTSSTTYQTADNSKIYAHWTAIHATTPTINSVNGATLTYGYESGSVSVSATAATGHTLSYQWYSNTTNSNSGGTAIDNDNAKSASYTIPTGKNAGTTEYYYCVVTATRTDNGETATASSNVVNVTISKATNPLTYTATQTVSKTYSTSAQTATLTSAANGQGDVTYAINSQKDSSNADVEYFSLDGTTLNIAANTPVGTYTVVVRASAAGNNNYNSGTKDSTVTVTIERATINPTVSITGWTYGSYNDTTNAPSVTGNNGSGTVTYQYKLKTASDTAYSNEVPTNAGTYTIKATIAQSTNYEDNTATADFTISPLTASVSSAPQANTHTYTGEAQTLITAGTTTNGTMKYAISNTDNAPEDSSQLWKANLTDITGTDAATYRVWYKVFANDTNHANSDAAYVDVKISKASALKTPPTAKNATRYSSAVQLINAGEVESGCTIEYQLGTNATDIPTDTWTTDATTITANKSGKYYVWYKVTGTVNYEDKAATPIEVNVSQYYAPPYSEQTWEMTMESYEYDGTAHTPVIDGKMYGDVTYTYYTADGTELNEAPSAVGSYKVVVYAEGGSTHYSRTQTAEYSITAKPAPTEYTVTVKNGTVNGATTASYAPDTVIVVKADKAPNGKKFAYWKKNGVTASYSASYTFPLSRDMELEAVYTSIADEFQTDGTGQLEGFNADKENGKLQIAVLHSVPQDCKILKAGLVATSDTSKLNNLTAANADYVKYYENITVHNFKYTWTKTQVTADQTWYVRSYLEYKDADGKIKVVYGDMVQATLDGYKVQVENKIVGTSNMGDVVKDTENNKLSFAALLNVPVDCTIKFAGVVATSDASKVSELTRIKVAEKAMVNGIYVRGMTSDKHTVKYTWNKTNVGTETWYVRSYLVYVDSHGKTQYVYGDLTTAKLN